MAYILLMTNFKEEESFYLFLTLMENILPYDYYLFAIGVEGELNILIKFLEFYQPDLIKYILSIKDCDLIIKSNLSKLITSLLLDQTDRNISNILFNCYFGFTLLENKDDLYFYFYKIIL